MEERRSPRIWVQLLGIAWIVGTFASIFMMDYEPGRGARGPMAGVSLGMFGGIFLYMAAFPDFFLMRLWVARYGEANEGTLRVVFVVGALIASGVGLSLAVR